MPSRTKALSSSPIYRRECLSVVARCHRGADSGVRSLLVEEVDVAAFGDGGGLVAHELGEDGRGDSSGDHAAGEGVAHGVEADSLDADFFGGGLEAASGGVAVGERLSRLGGKDRMVILGELGADLALAHVAD